MHTIALLTSDEPVSNLELQELEGTPAHVVLFPPRTSPPTQLVQKLLKRGEIVLITTVQEFLNRPQVWA